MICDIYQRTNCAYIYSKNLDLERRRLCGSLGPGASGACHTRRAGAHIEGPSVSSYPIFSFSFFWYITIRANAHHRRVLRGCVGVGCSAIGIVHCLIKGGSRHWLRPHRQRESRRRTRESSCGVHAQKKKKKKKKYGVLEAIRKRGSERIDISVAE